MGAVEVDIGVGNLNEEGLVSVLALVDTGASDSVLPESLLTQLKVEPWGRMTYGLADGSSVEYAHGTAMINIDGHSLPCPVVFGPEDQYLLGATALEIFHLTVDPIDQVLVPKRYRARPF